MENKRGIHDRAQLCLVLDLTVETSTTTRTPGSCFGVHVPVAVQHQVVGLVPFEWCQGREDAIVADTLGHEVVVAEGAAVGSGGAPVSALVTVSDARGVARR